MCAVYKGCDEAVGIELGNQSIRVKCFKIHAKEVENETDQETNAYDDSNKYDNDHDVVATHIHGDGEDEGCHEGEESCHDGDGVEYAREDIDNSLGQGHAVFVLDLESVILGHNQGDKTPETGEPEGGEANQI